MKIISTPLMPIGLSGLPALPSCTQGQQNRISHSVQNRTGTNGVPEFHAGDKLVRHVIRDYQGRQLSTAMGEQRMANRALIVMVTACSMKI